MKKIDRYMLILSVIIALFGLTGCKDDKLVMVTTERDNSTASDAAEGDTTESLADEVAATATATEEEKVRVEASGSDAGITMDELQAANRGDVLLAGGKGYSLNTIYYADNSEVYSEYQYIGFDDDGNYLQAYEDSNGFIQILDNSNLSWYIEDENVFSVLIYPEPGVGDAIIDYNHNELLVSKSDDTDENIKDIYRLDGELIVETGYKADGAEYTFCYALTDDLRVTSVTCYDTEGSKLSYSWVTTDITYAMPDEIKALRDTDKFRDVTVSFPEKDGVDCVYSVPAEIPVQIRMVEYSAYSDFDCAILWKEMDANEEGLYTDETIYMKK